MPLGTLSEALLSKQFVDFFLFPTCPPYEKISIYFLASQWRAMRASPPPDLQAQTSDKPAAKEQAERNLAKSAVIFWRDST
jgi:hypothetical protein